MNEIIVPRRDSRETQEQLLLLQLSSGKGIRSIPDLRAARSLTEERGWYVSIFATRRAPTPSLCATRFSSRSGVQPIS